MDVRNIRNGWEIPTENYCDQPYVIVTKDGGWLVVVTTGVGVEGEWGQHVVTMRSEDNGRTWSAPVDVEPADGPEASYAVLLQAPSGRIFCFYNHNTDNLRRVRADFPGGYWNRVDTLGHYVMRWSDDGGRSWSTPRVEIPVRMMQMDRENPYQGEVRFFWNVGRPLLRNGEAYLTLHRVGRFGEGAFVCSEGVILHSPDLVSLDDPAQARWETLPGGEIGLRAPEGPVAEEQCLALLSDGSLFCVYRTVAGSAACTYSRDGGHTWTEPDFMRYPDGRRMKHPRAANFVWKLEDETYMYWFHNQGGRSYEGRNPAWASLGREYAASNGRRIAWSDPEILLYDPDRSVRISYPDLVRCGDEYYVTQTQKTVARVNSIDGRMLAGLMNPVAPTDGEALGERLEGCADGFTFVLDANSTDGERVRVHGANGGEMWLGVCEGRLRLSIDDGECACIAFSDALPQGSTRAAVIVDARACVITFVVGGKLCDGGDRPRGWFRLCAGIVSGGVQKSGDVTLFRRALYTWEARTLTRE